MLRKSAKKLKCKRKTKNKRTKNKKRPKKIIKSCFEVKLSPHRLLLRTHKHTYHKNKSSIWSESCVKTDGFVVVLFCSVTPELNHTTVTRLLSFWFKISGKKKQNKTRVQRDIKSHIIDEFHHVDAALRG